MKKISQAWLDAAKDDLLTMKRLASDKALTHILAFHAQQCIEKSFKALIEEREAPVRKTHNLFQLHGVIIDFYPSLSNLDMVLLNALDQLYIDARYPSSYGLLPDGKPSLKEAEEFIDFAKNIYEETIKLLRG